jgi:hydrogenase maturation protease
MEPDPAEIEPIEDGQVVNPHGMDPQTVLRFVKTVGGWPGKVVVVACEPAAVEEMGLELSPEVEGAVDRAAKVVGEQIAELQGDERYADAGG